MFKKKVALSVFLMGIISLGVGFSFSNGKSIHADELNGPEVISYIIDDITGEKTNLSVKEIEEVSSISPFTSSDVIINKTKIFEVYAEIPIDSLIVPLIGSGSDKTSGGVTARVSVNYDLNTSKDQIRVNSYSGGWTPSSNLYLVGNRATGVHSGSVVGGKARNDYPTSNSFSYTNSWGYNNLAYGSVSPRAWADCKITVAGMSGSSHTLVVEHAFP